MDDQAGAASVDAAPAEPIPGRRRSSIVTALLLGPTSAWYFLLLVAPLVILVAFSFGARAPEGGYSPAFQLDNYFELPTRITAFTNTIWMAAGGTLLCLVVGYPLAYYLATRAGAKRTLLIILVVVPFWTSFLIRTYAWLTILGNNGIPALLERAGFGHVVLLNTPPAVLIGILYNYLPLMVFPLYVSLERLDKRLLEASKDLGAGRLATFRQVTLPLSAPGPAERGHPGLHPDHGRVHHPGHARGREGVLHRQRAGRPLPAVARLAVRLRRGDRPDPRHPRRGQPVPVAGVARPGAS